MSALITATAKMTGSTEGITGGVIEVTTGVVTMAGWVMVVVVVVPPAVTAWSILGPADQTFRHHGYHLNLLTKTSQEVGEAVEAG